MSSFSDPLSLMQLAMMMAEAMFSRLLERSIFSVGLVPLSSSIGSGWPSTLRARQAKCSAGTDTLGSLASALDALQSGADRDVLCKSLGRLGANALARQIPRFDLVTFVLAQSLEERSPALVAKLVAAQTASGAGNV